VVSEVNGAASCIEKVHIGNMRHYLLFEMIRGFAKILVATCARHFATCKMYWQNNLIFQEETTAVTTAAAILLLLILL
jgi:hypothetical protein